MDYLARFNVPCACCAAFAEFASQSLRYWKGDKSAALILLCSSVYLALPHLHFIVYRCD